MSKYCGSDKHPSLPALGGWSGATDLSLRGCEPARLRIEFWCGLAKPFWRDEAAALQIISNQ